MTRYGTARRLLVWATGASYWFAVAALAVGGQGDNLHLGPEGYRMSHYRAPTPAMVAHARTIDTPTLVRLIDTVQPVLVDVQAVVVRPESEQFGASWLPAEPRFHIPDSVWLPNVGYGRLEPRMDQYFRTNLARLTAGDLDRAVVIYCVLDCWMSWNAVQRAAAYGYRNLYWYREGTDGWREHDLPLVEATPVPVERSGNNNQ